jgi:hypothetical protein
MPIPTDRGYVVVVDETDGTKTVLIGADANGGYPKTVYAMHRAPVAVVVHPDVELHGNEAARQFTADLAEVFVDDDGAVHVARVEGLVGLTTT